MNNQSLLVYFLLCETPWWFDRPIFYSICCDDFPIYCDSQTKVVRMVLSPPKMTSNLRVLRLVQRPTVEESAFEPIQVEMLSFVAKMAHHIRLVIESWNHNRVNENNRKKTQLAPVISPFVLKTTDMTNDQIAFSHINHTERRFMCDFIVTAELQMFNWYAPLA